jgi:hypothetical protein
VSQSPVWHPFWQHGACRSPRWRAARAALILEDGTA